LDWTALGDTNILIDAGVKIFVAALLGGVVGLEREMHGQAAGFRTYILVSIGCCLMMMISLHMEVLYQHLDDKSVVRLDPARIASYALAGMGFLGAGAIITGRGSVRGLTTAAGMWMISGVGLAVGTGYFVPAVLVTVLSLFSLYVLRYTKPFFKRDVNKTLFVVSDDIGGQLKRIEAVMDGYPFSKIQFVDFNRELKEGVISFRITVVCKEDLEWRQFTQEITELPGLRSIALEEARID
jgi:putative Mg2+ transporter-C (MgtC) family protein